MARRHLTLTLNITLDEDTCRNNEPDVNDLLAILRTEASFTAAHLLHHYDAAIENPAITHHGLTYETPDPDDTI